MLTSFEEYQLLLGKLISAFQLIEHDLKCIAQLLNGELSKQEISKLPLGKVISALEGNSLQLFDADDFLLLKALVAKRNFYCHQCVISFIYEPDFENTDSYSQSFTELKSDYNIVKKLAKQAEDIRIQLIERLASKHD